MAEQWFIRVEGKEYGPADLETLREWKEDGRVLPTNDVRRADDVDLWITAGKIPGLFETAPPPVQTETERAEAAAPVKPPGSLGKILGQTLAIYFRGFFQYLCLTLLVLTPSLCAQLAAPVIDTAPNIDVDLRRLVGFALAFCMSVLALVLWPIYIAGIQILTAQRAGGDRISFLKVLNAAASFWPRVAFLCIYVGLCFLFWTVAPVALIFSLVVGTPSLLSIFLVLLVLAFQVWITSRLFVNFMFWQQFAVLENCTIAESLVRSRELARSRHDLPWHRRPIWRGALLASLWIAIVIALNWPALQFYFQTYSQAIATTTDPQVLLEKLREASKKGPTAALPWLALAQAVLRPLLGISFVLLFLDTNRE